MFNKDSQIFFQFSNEVALFDDIVKFKYNSRGNSLQMTLPIICYYGNYFDKKKLFETEFTTIISSKSQLKKFSDLNYVMVNVFFKKHFSASTFLNELYEKAKLWIATDEPQATYFTNVEGIAEYIRVDDETSFYGNYKYDNKEYCKIIYGVNHRVREDITSLKFTPYISHFDIPHPFRDEKIHGDMTSEERINVLLSLGLKSTLVDIIKNQMNQDHSEIIEERCYPFKIRLQGTDDDSHTRYFYTEAEMMDEVYRLRRCQPINKWIDVTNNNYHFTN